MGSAELMEKIRLLLAKAEGTDNEHEADAFLAKAQALMTDAAITEAMLNSSKPRDEQTKPIQRMWNIPGPYSKQKATLLWRIGHAQGCKSLWSTPSRWDSNTQVWLVGFEDDLERIDGLFTLLLSQLARQVSKVRPDPSQEVWDERTYRYRTISTRLFRANWADGFASRVASRLAEAARMAKNEAEATSGNGVALALVDKEQAIANAYAEFFPNVGKGRSSYSRGSSIGYREGAAAGERADIGNRRVSGSRGALNA